MKISTVPTDRISNQSSKTQNQSSSLHVSRLQIFPDVSNGTLGCIHSLFSRIVNFACRKCIVPPRQPSILVIIVIISGEDNDNDGERTKRDAIFKWFLLEGFSPLWQQPVTSPSTSRLNFQPPTNRQAFRNDNYFLRPSVSPWCQQPANKAKGKPGVAVVTR